MQTLFKTSAASFKKFLYDLTELLLKMCHNEDPLPSLFNERDALFFFYQNNDRDRT